MYDFELMDFTFVMVSLLFSYQKSLQLIIGDFILARRTNKSKRSNSRRITAQMKTLTLMCGSMQLIAMLDFPVIQILKMRSWLYVKCIAFPGGFHVHLKFYTCYGFDFYQLSQLIMIKVN